MWGPKHIWDILWNMKYLNNKSNLSDFSVDNTQDGIAKILKTTLNESNKENRIEIEAIENVDKDFIRFWNIIETIDDIKKVKISRDWVDWNDESISQLKDEIEALIDRIKDKRIKIDKENKYQSLNKVYDEARNKIENLLILKGKRIVEEEWKKINTMLNDIQWEIGEINWLTKKEVKEKEHKYTKYLVNKVYNFELIIKTIEKETRWIDIAQSMKEMRINFNENSDNYIKALAEKWIDYAKSIRKLKNK